MTQASNIYCKHAKVAPRVRVLWIHQIGARLPAKYSQQCYQYPNASVDLATDFCARGNVAAVPRLFGRLEAGVSVIASPAVTQLTWKRLPKGKPLQAKLHAFCRQNVPEGKPA